MGNTVDRATLDLDLRLGRVLHIRYAQRRARPRLSQNLRQLGAVGPYVPEPKSGSQQAVVRGWFGKPGATGAYLTYLQKGKGPEGKHAALFSRQNQGLDPQQFLRHITQDPHQFRWSISLRDTPRSFDFQAYIVLVMKQVERDFGRSLDWLAAVHHDRPHLHAHVVLRGRDRDERPIYVTTDYLSHGLRYRASALATILLGPEKTLEREQNREPNCTPQHVTGATLEPEHNTRWRVEGHTRESLGK